MKHEKTQKGNPHQLAISQHVFPAKSISRFLSKENTVDVFLIKQVKIIQTIPTDGLFCAKRVWDERTETSFMKSVEDKFQKIAEEVIAGQLVTFNAEMTRIISDFFCLWNIRAHWKNTPLADQSLSPDVLGLSHNVSDDEQELLEKNHISAIKPDLTISGRMIAGPLIQMNTLRCRKQMADANWGILTCRDAEFIVPDNFPTLRVVPLTPKMCLYSPSENAVIEKSEVETINKLAVESSREWYFARDLIACPH